MFIQPVMETAIQLLANSSTKAELHTSPDHSSISKTTYRVHNRLLNHQPIASWNYLHNHLTNHIYMEQLERTRGNSWFSHESTTSQIVINHPIDRYMLVCSFEQNLDPGVLDYLSVSYTACKIPRKKEPNTPEKQKLVQDGNTKTL